MKIGIYGLEWWQHGDYPVQLTYYGFWYRRKEKSLLTQINDENNSENELRIKDINEEANKITNNVEAVVLSNEGVNLNTLKELDDIILPWNRKLPKNSKETILYIMPATGMDIKLYYRIKKESKSKNIIIISFGLTEKSSYVLRQKYERFATVFELPTFLSSKYWLGFINYVIQTRQIKTGYTTDELKKVLQDKINMLFNEINYNENEFLYKVEIVKCKIRNTFILRVIRELINEIKKIFKDN